MYNQVKARAIWTFTIFHPFYKTEGVVLPNVFQNGFSSSRGAAPSEEPKPELFSEEPEPRQTGPQCGVSFIATMVAFFFASGFHLYTPLSLRKSPYENLAGQTFSTLTKFVENTCNIYIFK